MSDCLPGADLVMADAALALVLASGRSADEISLPGDLFSAIGDNLSLIASKKVFRDESGKQE